MFYYNIKILPSFAIYVYVFGSKKIKYIVLRDVKYENRTNAWWVQIRYKCPIIVY